MKEARELEEQGNVRICNPAEVRGVRGDGSIQAVTLENTTTGETFEVECDALITLLAHSHLGSIADWGLDFHGKRQILVEPSTMETSLPSVYAAGDVAGYEGKITLISVGFGEAAIAANQAIARIRGEKVQPKYSTINDPRPANRAPGRASSVGAGNFSSGFRAATGTRLQGVSETAPRELGAWKHARRSRTFGLGRADPDPRRRWLGRIKAAAARANAELGLLDPEKAERIAAAGDRIAAGEFDDQFPIDVFQTGSGTSSNMNANEVMAALAGEDVHANDDVNMGQSSNDVFPSAVHLAALDGLATELLPSLTALAEALERKATEFADLVKSGRTHLMDAVPVTLGQEFGGYAAQVRQGIARIEATLGRVGQIPLGGTATAPA